MPFQNESRPASKLKYVFAVIAVVAVAMLVIGSNVDVIVRWVVDYPPPQVTLLHPSDDETINTATTYFNWTGAEGDGTELYFVWYADTQDTFTSPFLRIVDVNTTENYTPPDFQDGHWYWRVQVNDTTESNTSVTWHFIIQTNVSNHFPSLEDGTVSPWNGTSTEVYTYTVNFTDEDNDSATWAYVVIDGTNYSMSESDAGDTNTADGKEYTYSTFLTSGDHNFSFICSDGEAVNSTQLFLAPNVTYAEPDAPIISDPIPEDGELYADIPLSYIGVTVTDPDGNLMDVYLYTNESGSWTLFNSSSNVGNGSYEYTNVSWATGFGVRFWWSVNVTDGVYWTNETFWFRTETMRAFAIYPEDNDTIYDVQPTLVFRLINPTGNTMNYSIYYGNSSGNTTTLLETVNSIGNDTYYFVEYYNATERFTAYYWRVMTDSGGSYVNNTFSFQIAYPPSAFLPVNSSFLLLLGVAGIIFGLMALILALRHRKEKKAIRRPRPARRRI